MEKNRDVLALELEVKIPARFRSECQVPEGYIISSLQAMAAAERAATRVQEDLRRMYPEVMLALTDLASKHLEQEIVELLESARQAKLEMS